MTFQTMLNLMIDNKNLKFSSEKAHAMEQTWDTIIYWGLVDNKHLEDYRDADDWKVEEPND